MCKKIIYFLLAFFMLFSVNITLSNAQNDKEQEFNAIIEKYKEKEIFVDNGIVLELGESIDISEFKNIQLTNNNVVKIENNILRAVNYGTVFLSREKDGKVYITEIYVKKDDTSKTRIYNKYDSNKYRVFIDPGHGGSDPGAISNGERESDLNLTISMLLKDKLEDKGIEVLLSREDDVFLTLEERGILSNEYNPDVFVSIHQNSAQSSASGIETYYHTDKIEYKPLSTDIQTKLIENTNAKNRGVKSANFSVLRTTYSPSSLVECGFISNVDECEKLTDPIYQDKIAMSIADGIEKYLIENVELNDSNIPAIKKGQVIDCDTLNIRSGPGSNYIIIGTLQNGDTVDILGKFNNWYKIKSSIGYGYVYYKYIKLIEDEVVNFTDIEGHWAIDSINKFVSSGIMEGYEDNTFRPDNDVTRAEFIKMVNKNFGFTEEGEVNFTDVDKNSWYYQDLKKAIKAGYISGYDDGTFKPDDSISREEVAEILRKIDNLNGDGILEFSDNDSIGKWAINAVDAVSDNGFMNGYEDGSFRPKNKLTRAEAVVILDRFSNKISK